MVSVPYRSSLADDDAKTISTARHSVQLRARQSIHSGPIVAIAGVLFALTFWLIGAGVLSLLWTVLIILTAAVNRWVCRRVVESEAQQDAAVLARQEQSLWWMTVMNSLSVGSGIWLVSADGMGREVLIVITMAQALYSLGALINASTHPPTFIAGIVVNFGSLIIFWLSTGNTGALAAITLLGLGYILTRFSYQIYEQFHQSISIRDENSALLAQLRKQVGIADAARVAAEQASRAKSQFLASASHDLRQPLHSLLLFTGLLDQSGPEKRTEFLNHIRTAANSLDTLFSGLLDLSKLDAGVISANKISVDVAEVVDQIVSEFEPMAQEKGVHLSADTEPYPLVTDPFLLERILRNLVDNAVKYTHVGEISVSLVANPKAGKIIVTDSGVGIPAEELDAIFEEFHRVREEDVPTADGSGLGLAIVARLSDMLGMRVRVRSEPGRGSEFTLDLPPPNHQSGEPSDSMSGTTPGTYRGAQGLRVLVVDDEPAIRRAMQATLEQIGATGLTFDSFDHLERELAEGNVTKPDALITDYRLPGARGGYQVIELVRRHFPDLPAVIFSGDIELIQSESAPELATVPVFRKPVSQSVLAGWLAQVNQASRTSQAH